MLVQCKRGWAVAALIATTTLLTGLNVPDRDSDVVMLRDLTIDRTTGLRLYRGQPFTGEARAYHGDDVLARAEQFVAGRRDGFLRMWFADGSLGFDATYVSGRREGLTRSWWDNGNRRSQTFFVNDKPHGVAWSWYASGETLKRYNYDMGRPDGLQQGWRLNGKLFSNFEYRNGRAYGLRNSNMCIGLEDEQLVPNY